MSVIHGVNYGTPTLDLNFAKNKSLIDTASGRNLVTFTRAQTAREATYVGADGLIKSAVANEARFDHNPVTGESLGLLVEQARTNLVLYSGDFSQASWDKSSTSVVNTTDVTDVLGTNTAIKLLDKPSASGFANHGLNGNWMSGSGGISISPSTSYTASFFAKKYQNRDISFQFATRNSSNSTIAAVVASFNLTNGTTTLNTASGGLSPSTLNPIAYTVEYPNGWYRCVFTITTRSDSATLNDTGAYMVPNTSSSYGYTGDGVSGVYLCASQLEAGAFPTSYIPTTASTVTRSADVASITGSNFSSWYNQSQSTILTFGSCFNPSPVVTSPPALFAGFNSDVAVHRFHIGPTGSYQRGTNGTTFAYTQNSLTKVAVSWNPTTNTYGEWTDCKDGTIGGTYSANATFPLYTNTRMSVGSNFNEATPLNGRIVRITYYPTRLQDFQLRQLTK